VSADSTNSKSEVTVMPSEGEQTRPAKSRIPEFSSYEEEANWWDTHDITDYLDELKPVKVRVAKDLTHVLQIPFDSKDMGALSARAKEKGTDVITLARQWVLERLRREEGW
jgi:hypothetical protein